MVLPTVGAMGVCDIKEPFTLADGDIARVIGVDTFEALSYRGIDVKQKHYLDAGLDEAAYAADFNDSPYVVTIIVVGTSAPMFVPMSFFRSYPSLGEVVPYDDMAMVVKIGLLPSGLGVTTVAEKTKEIVNSTLGVEAEVSFITLPLKGGVNYDQSMELESARVAKIDRTITTADQLIDLRRKYADQLEYAAILERTITQNGNT